MHDREREICIDYSLFAASNVMIGYCYTFCILCNSNYCFVCLLSRCMYVYFKQ